MHRTDAYHGSRFADCQCFFCHVWNLLSNSASGSSPNSSESKSPVTSQSQQTSHTPHDRQTSSTSQASPHSGQNISTPLSASAYGTLRTEPFSSDELGGWCASRASQILGFDE